MPIPRPPRPSADDLRRFYARRTVDRPIARPSTPQPRESMPHYWHPQRFGVRFPSDAFRAELHRLHPRAEVVWSPVHERWLVWERSLAVTHPLCAGWSLKFMHQTPAGAYLPLDARFFAILYARDPRRFGGSLPYYDRIASEILRERQSRRDRTDADSADLRREYYDYRKIKNIGAGNKFALHHDGSIIASPGEILWRQQRDRR